MVNCVDLIKNKDLSVSMSCPYPYDMIGVFGWLVKCMDKWNETTDISNHPRVEARIISRDAGDGKSEIKLQMFSGSKMILADTLMYNAEGNFFVEYSKFSAHAMMKVIHSGLANLILLTPINSN